MFVSNVKASAFETGQLDVELVPVGYKGNKKNTYTIIIGKNGTFKSTCMRIIADECRKQDNQLSKLVEFSEEPTRVIAVSSTNGDKFSTARHNVFPEWLYRGKNFDVNYFYFGPKYRNSYSNRNTIKQLIDAIAFGTNAESSRVKIRTFLQHIGLQPKLEFHLKESKRLAKMDKDKSKLQLEEIIKKRLSNNGSLAKRVNQALKSMEETSKGRKITIDLEKDQNIAEMLAAISILTHRNQLQVDKIFILKANKSNDVIDINDLSSGESRLFLKSIALACTVTDNSLVLIDEPENSLHPEWQIRFLANLQAAFEAVSGCHIIISTHSPHILSSADPELSFVVPLERENNVSTGRPLEGSVYGWSVENILLNLFGLATTRNYYFEMKVRELLSQLGPNMNKTKAQNLIAELEQYEMGNTDPLNTLLDKARKMVT